MELDQLKEMWSDVGSKEQGPSADELQALLQKKSKSPIAKMKRNLLIELLLIVIIYVFTVTYYFLNYSGGMLSAAWMLMVIGVFYVFYYLRKRRLLNQMECVSCEIKSNLKMQLVTLEKYVRFYMISGTLLVPVVFVITGLIVLLYSPEAASVPAVKTTSFLLKSSAVLFVAAIVFTIPIYFANKWYVRKLYGQHIERLKKIVDEMNED
ncbi:MAG: hypothetical protein IPK31_06980 [Chitinophagaceae bacterium]|nr:hypothetical protein [Chitinophagaceae bacterium]